MSLFHASTCFEHMCSSSGGQNCTLQPLVGPQWHSGYGAVLQIGMSLVPSQLVSLKFFIDIKSFRSHYGPGVDSASNRNEYQEHFLGVKATGA